MKLVDPVVYVENYNGEEITRYLGNMASTSYNFEFDISKDNYKDLLLKCIQNGHDSVLEHKTITIKIIADNGVYKDIIRHRCGASFTNERYDRLTHKNELEIIKPVHIEEGTELYDDWKDCIEKLDESYKKMLKEGATAEQLRMVAPYSIAVEMNLTCNIREWRHLFSLRCSHHTHPAIRQVLIPALVKFKQDMPELFGDVEYDVDFPKEKYAKLLPLEII